MAQIFSSSAAGAWKGGDGDRADQLQFTQQQCGGGPDDRRWWREVAGDKRGVLGPAMTSLQRCESKRPLHLMTVLDVPITVPLAGAPPCSSAATAHWAL